MKNVLLNVAILVVWAIAVVMLFGSICKQPVRAQSPFDCDPIYEDAERADTPAERQALAQLYIACMVRENWR